jgi:uncharacterized protein
MNKKQIIAKTKKYVQEALAGDSSGHDWYHIERVSKQAMQLAKKEKADLFVVELAALLHDIADWKFHKGDFKVGSKVARKWLESLGVEDKVVDHVAQIVKDVSFKGAKVKVPKMKTIEGMVVQDADRLDAIGAIGIGRTFAFGGSDRRMMHDPKSKPIAHKSTRSYAKTRSSTINHFYEKLLLLKDLMNTKAARKLAAQRHRYMEQFLEQFNAEWNGKR